MRGGDFFASVPSHGDLYIISRVLLNWEDEYALKILKNCRAAMSPSAKLLIMDFLLPNQNPTALDFLTSLHLLVLGGRLLRTEAEYYALLSAAGFHSPRLIQMGASSVLSKRGQAFESRGISVLTRLKWSCTPGWIVGGDFICKNYL